MKRIVNNPFITAREVMQILSICESGAYKVIKDLNEELNQKGFKTIRGKTNRKYLFERFGIEAGSDE